MGFCVGRSPLLYGPVPTHIRKLAKAQTHHRPGNTRQDKELPLSHGAAAGQSGDAAPFHWEKPEIRNGYLRLISGLCSAFEHRQVLYQSVICTAHRWRPSLLGICLVKSAKTLPVKVNMANPQGEARCPQHLTTRNCLGTAGDLSPAPGDRLQTHGPCQRKCQDGADEIILKCHFIKHFYCHNLGNYWTIDNSLIPY